MLSYHVKVWIHWECDGEHMFLGDAISFYPKHKYPLRIGNLYLALRLPNVEWMWHNDTDHDGTGVDVPQAVPVKREPEDDPRLLESLVKILEKADAKW
jgi:hypothetical protein